MGITEYQEVRQHKYTTWK